MSKMRNLIFGAALLALPVATPVFAAATLDDLLESVRTVRAHEEQSFKERSSAFSAAPAAQQEQMLQQALAKRQALAATSDTLSAEFSANELKISEKKKELRDKGTGLGLTEIFGLSSKWQETPPRYCDNRSYLHSSPPKPASKAVMSSCAPTPTRKIRRQLPSWNEYGSRYSAK